MSPFTCASSLTAAAVAAMVMSAILVATVDARIKSTDPSTRHHRMQSTLQRNLKTRGGFPNGLSCNLFMKDVEYAPTNENPQGYSVDEWFCELSIEDSMRLGIQPPYFLDIENSTSVVPDGTLPGQSILIATEATVDLTSTTLYIPNKANVTVERRKRSRKLARTRGILDTLVIRVMDSKGASPEPGLDQLRNDVFKDKASLKTQFEACSYGQLRVRGYSGMTETNFTIVNGVVDLMVDYDVEGMEGGRRTTLQNTALQVAEKTIGNLRSQFDVVMFCMPPGTGNWLAYAFVGDQFSFYNNEWCTYVSAQLHEVGHNLGLAHSGIGSGNGTDAYLDQQGIMGISYGKDDQRMCYNPAKSYQLGWYDDKVKTINPLSRDPDEGIGESAAGVFTMNGVSDYEKNDSALIVLRLAQNISGKDYFVGYNRKDGINADTPEDGDKITIVRKEEGLPDEFGASTKVASLDPGESHIIENYDETGRDVKVSFIALRDGNATIQVADVQEQVADVEEQKTTIKTTIKTTKKGKAVSKQKVTTTIKDASCAPHRIEFTTDSSPENMKWFILEDGGIGRVYATSPKYTEQETLYTDQFCLPYDVTYNFFVKYGDGESISRGNFTVYDEKDNIVFSDMSMTELIANGVQVRSFVAVKNPSFIDSSGISAGSSLERFGTTPIKPSKVKPKTINQPTRMQRKRRRKGRRRKIPPKKSSSCKDEKLSPFTWSEGQRRLSCQEISEKEKCDVIWFKTNKPLWQVCQRSCKKCDELLFV